MRMRNNSNALNELKDCEKFIETKEDLNNIIGNKKVNIEIGMGKGQFIINTAFENKDEIFIGIELCKSVLALAVKKIKRFEEENNVKLDNLYIMSFDAIEINDYFSENQIKTLYLNFSDPWPKSKHAKRRLTNEKFLIEYRKIIENNGYLRFKTDNIKLFEYSLVTLSNFGFYFEKVYLDLHNADIKNICTEYEEKFSAKGPIYMIICRNIKND